MMSRPLGLAELAERIELEIGGDHARHLASQRRSDGDDRRADAE